MKWDVNGSRGVFLCNSLLDCSSCVLLRCHLVDSPLRTGIIKSSPASSYLWPRKLNLAVHLSENLTKQLHSEKSSHTLFSYSPWGAQPRVSYRCRRRQRLGVRSHAKQTTGRRQNIRKCFISARSLQEPHRCNKTKTLWCARWSCKNPDLCCSTVSQLLCSQTARIQTHTTANSKP